MSELKKLAEELLKVERKSTRVVAWYAHSKEVRGPWCRWFTCSEVAPEYKQHVAYTGNDCIFAANAMNTAPMLAKAVLVMHAALSKIAMLDKDTRTGEYWDKLTTHTLDAKQALAETEKIASGK